MIPDGHALLAGAAVLLAVLLARPDAASRLRRLAGAPPDSAAGPSGGGADDLTAPRRLLPGHGKGRVPAGRRGRAPEGGAEVDEALVLDLVASALAAGTPPEAALAVVGAAVGGARGAALERVAARLRLGSSWAAAWQDDGPQPSADGGRAAGWRPAVRRPSRRLADDPGDRPPARADRARARSPGTGSTGRTSGADVAALRRALGLAVSTGAPASGLLQETAADLRRRRHRQAQAAAARLGVRMVLPLGLCSLPAFLAWAVLPVVLSLAGRLLSG